MLAGCNQSVDELLKIGENIFQELMKSVENEETTTEEGNEETLVEYQDNEVVNESQNESNEGAENVASTNDALAFQGEEDYTPFHIRLQEQGYDLYSLPNGFPFNVPYHWVLVKGLFGTEKHYFEGEFCFDLPYSVDGLIDVFGNYTGADVTREGEGGGFFERTAYTLNNEIYNTSGTVNYYTDHKNNTCSNLSVDYSTAEIFFSLFCEDHSNMLGPCEPNLLSV